jgi:hypothetical protein
MSDDHVIRKLSAGLGRGSHVFGPRNAVFRAALICLVVVALIASVSDRIAGGPCLASSTARLAPLRSLSGIGASSGRRSAAMPSSRAAGWRIPRP